MNEIWNVGVYSDLRRSTTPEAPDFSSLARCERLVPGFHHKTQFSVRTHEMIFPSPYKVPLPLLPTSSQPQSILHQIQFAGCTHPKVLGSFPVKTSQKTPENRTEGSIAAKSHSLQGPSTFDHFPQESSTFLANFLVNS